MTSRWMPSIAVRMTKRLNPYLLSAAVLALAATAAPAWAYYLSGYGGGGGGATQRPSAYGSGGYGRYYSPAGNYVGIDTGGTISTPHRGAWYQYQAALNNRPVVAIPCGGYLRAPAACRQHTLSYTAYQQLNR
jgi:hypothetical protein